jgi:predicted transcriptional regulator
MENFNLELVRLLNLIKEAEQYNKREDAYRTGRTLKDIKKKIQTLISKT